MKISFDYINDDTIVLGLNDLVVSVCTTEDKF